MLLFCRRKDEEAAAVTQPVIESTADHSKVKTNIIKWKNEYERSSWVLFGISLLLFMLMTSLYLFLIVKTIYPVIISLWLSNFFIIICTWAATIPVHLQQNKSRCCQWGDALKWSFALYYLMFFTFFFYDWTTKELISLVSTRGKVLWFVLANAFYGSAFLSLSTMRDALNALYPEYEACCEQVNKISRFSIVGFVTVLLVLSDGLIPIWGVTEEEIVEAFDIYSEELSSEDFITAKYFRAQNTVEDFALYASSLVIGMSIGLTFILKIFYFDVMNASMGDLVQLQISNKEFLIAICLFFLFMVGISLGTWRSQFDSIYLELVITVTLSMLLIISVVVYFSSRDVLRTIQKKSYCKYILDRMKLSSDERIRTLAEQIEEEKDDVVVNVKAVVVDIHDEGHSLEEGTQVQEEEQDEDESKEMNTDQVDDLETGSTSSIHSYFTAMNSTRMCNHNEKEMEKKR